MKLKGLQKMHCLPFLPVQREGNAVGFHPDITGDFQDFGNAVGGQLNGGGDGGAHNVPSVFPVARMAGNRNPGKLSLPLKKADGNHALMVII